MNPKDWKPTQEMIDAATELFKAMTWVNTIKPVVEGYKNEILQRWKFKVTKEFREREDDVITLIRDDYLMSEEDFAIYLQECYKAAKAVGLALEDADHCPLLKAERSRTEAEWELMKVMEPITNVGWKRLFGENREKYLDLTLRLLAPFVDKEAACNSL